MRGPESCRLDEWIARELSGTDPFVCAYGDSSGDKELWARADRAVRLGRHAHKGTGASEVSSSALRGHPSRGSAFLTSSRESDLGRFLPG